MAWTGAGGGVAASCELWPKVEAGGAAASDVGSQPALPFLVRVFLSTAAKLTPQGPAAVAQQDAQYTAALPSVYVYTCSVPTVRMGS